MTQLSLEQVTARFADYQAGALPVSVAQAIIREFIPPLTEHEDCSLIDAMGRVLAQDVISPINVPPHDNSAMDGFAFRGEDLLTGPSIELSIVGEAFAGLAFTGTVKNGECIRIMTGAIMPAGCDTVLPQEHADQVTQASVTFSSRRLERGDNRRLCGEDLQRDRPALLAGKVLKPADIGLIASLGIDQVRVFRKLRVAFFSTGNEIRSLGETLDPGCVFDSNRYTLTCMLQRLGCELIDMGVVKDDPALLEDALRHACSRADVIITSGGVSVGAADYTRHIMARLGDVAFWTIGMRPGRPMAFGQISHQGKQAYLFGLPGNPVAVMVTFYFFVRDALLHRMGASSHPLPLVSARSCTPLRKRPGRTEYQRGIAKLGVDGKLEVRLTGAQGSGILRSMSEANCIVVLHHEQSNVAAGENVDIVLFDGLV